MPEDVVVSLRFWADQDRSPLRRGPARRARRLPDLRPGRPRPVTYYVERPAPEGGTERVAWGWGALLATTLPKGEPCPTCGKKARSKNAGLHVYLFGPPKCTPCAEAWCRANGGVLPGREPRRFDAPPAPPAPPHDKNPGMPVPAVSEQGSLFPAVLP